MSDLISRKDAIEATWKAFLKVCEIKDKAGWQNTEPTFAVLEAMSDISRLPSADRPTGRWVTLERDENVYDIYGVPTWGVNYMCDKCGFITTAIQNHFGQYKFCPNCGAKMRGNTDD